MQIRYIFASFLIGCLLFQVPSLAQDSAGVASATKFEWTGMAALVEGQFVKCNYYLDGGAMPFRPWLTNEYVRVGLRASLNPHFRIAVIPQIKLWNDTWDWTHMNAGSAANNPLNQHSTISLADAEGIFSFGSPDVLLYTVAAGVIPYKYDSEAKNLGEYLFRTGEHPAYIETFFDEAYATMSGLRVNAEIFRTLSVDLFLTTETEIQPMSDWSLSFLLGYKVPGYVDIGVGAMFDRLIPAVPILDKNDGGGGRPNTFKTSTGQVDSFSWGGTKIVAHLSVDPKGFLPSNISRIFGKEDGKIYGEAAILGVKNITAYKDSTDPNSGLSVPGHYVIDSANNFYSDIKQRIPVMAGFTIPTFKFLDYLSAELEWFGWPYSRNLYNLENFKYILPKPIGKSNASSMKFSFNMKKTVWKRISVIGQIARDHTRHDVYFNGNVDVDEVFQMPDEWGWWLKLQYNF
jgi:hypothetical protein